MLVQHFQLRFARVVASNSTVLVSFWKTNVVADVVVVIFGVDFVELL